MSGLFVCLLACFFVVVKYDKNVKCKIWELLEVMTVVLLVSLQVYVNLEVVHLFLF